MNLKTRFCKLSAEINIGLLGQRSSIAKMIFGRVYCLSRKYIRSLISLLFKILLGR